MGVLEDSVPIHNQARMQRIGDTNQFVIVATDEGLNNIPALNAAQRTALTGSNQGGAHRHVILLDRVEENGIVRFVPTRAFTGTLRADEDLNSMIIDAISTLNLRASGASVETMPQRVGISMFRRDGFMPMTESIEIFIRSTSSQRLGQAGNLERALAQAADPSYQPSEVVQEGPAIPRTVAAVAPKLPLGTVL